MATFVLVHGAWHGGWCYRSTAEILRRRGHTVFAPTLTGLGERSHLNSGGVSLSTHIKDICNTIEWEDLEDIVLCGHSYGGMVITGVAHEAPTKISSLIYLDAFLPSGGAAAWDYLDPVRRNAYLAGTAEHSGMNVPAPPSRLFNVDQAKEEWIDGKCTPMPLACFLEPLSIQAVEPYKGKKGYIIARDWTGSEAMQRAYEECAVDPEWTVREIHAGHDLMIDRPMELADALEELI